MISKIIIPLLFVSTTFAKPLKLKILKDFSKSLVFDQNFVKENLTANLDSEIKIIQNVDSNDLSQLRNLLKDLDGEILSYIPENSYAVKIKKTALKFFKNKKREFVIRDYHPAYKIDPELIEGFLKTNKKSNQKLHVNIVPFNKMNKIRIQNFLKNEFRIQTKEFDQESYYLSAELNAKQIMHLAKFDDVSWIDKTSLPELDMDKAHQTLGVETLNRGRSNPFTGIGIKGHVLEGIEASHQDFEKNEYREAPIAIGDSEKSSHGHATYGEIFGSGKGNKAATGLVPNAQGYYTNYNYVMNKDGARYALNKDLMELGIMFQTASWGYSRNTTYSTYSAEMDHIIFNLDMPITQSQSNSGTRASRPQAWAKNIISVGAFYHFDNTDKSDDKWNGGASIGPSEDGRIKPDVSAFYDKILTTDLGNGYTTSFGGTSGATPIIAGTVGMLQEMWIRNVFKPALFEPADQTKRPHFTTTKALLINSAAQYAFKSGNDDFTRVHQGWGHPDMGAIHDKAAKALIVNESQILKTQGEEKIFKFTVDKINKNFKATLVYSEPAADPSATQQLINDIDLKVTSPSGKIYWGNNGLFDGMFSIEGGAANNVDPVENVIIENAEMGEWEVKIIASEINMDNHLETIAVDLDFALVVTGNM